MGFLDLGGDKPKVTEHEFNSKVRSSLHNKGFNQKELDQLEGFLRGDMHGGRPLDKGIDARELDHSVGWLRENKHAHSFSDTQIGHIEEELRKHL